MADSFVTYSLTSGGLPDATFVVSFARVVEELNAPYRVEVAFRSNDPAADLSLMLGQDFALEIRRGANVRRVVGVVRHIEEGEQTEDVAPKLVGVPALWMLGLRRNTRIFQEKTVTEILEDVLGAGLSPYSRSARLDVEKTYPRREYCVQYQETDLDFVHRLVEEEGIHYAFEHDGEQEVLVFYDANAQHPEVPTGKTIPLQAHNLAVHDEEPIVLFRRRHRATTTSVVVADWDWTKGTMPFDAEARSTDDLGRDRESYEHSEGRSLTIWDYDAGAKAYQSNDASEQATLRKEAANQGRILGQGIGRVISMAPGQRFELVGHPTAGVDAEYILVRVEHVSRVTALGAADDTNQDAYHNRFECIPASVPYRPERRAQKPSVHGVQTAVVVGPAGEEIHTDEHGRIKVQLHWDREGQNDADSSCWIRVQQAWSGAGWGFWYLPRIGMEVVVHFVDGDPDRPLVTGCLYNANNLPPYPLPDEKTKSTIKSNSSLGGGGFNELRFEDKKGSEEIFTHAQKDYNEVVEHDHTTLVHNDQSNEIDRDQTQLVKNNQTETVQGNQTMTVDGNRKVQVKADYDETIEGTEKRTVTGDVTETFDATETRTITGNVDETIGAEETRQITGAHKETVDGSESITRAAGSTHIVSTTLDQSVDAGISVTTPMWQIQALAGFNVTATGGIKLNAGTISLSAPGGVTMVDQFWEWAGVFKNGSGGFKRSYTHIKDEFAGVTMEVNVLKGELEVFNASQVGVEIKTAGLAVLSPITNIWVGAVRVENGPEVG
ncbi:MAG: type VI secretion system Vgr family protein [Sandaracinaceae bacterium]